MTLQSCCKHILLTGALTGLMSSFSLPLDAISVQARPLGSPAGNSSTGAVRGACPAIDTSLQNRKLMALVDTNDPTLTTQTRPTFWVYLPFTQTEDVTTAEFELFDENMESVLANSKIAIPLPKQAGLARFTLPATEPPLVAGKEYFWVFRVVCDQNDRSGNPTVTGWIKRVEPATTLVNRLKSMPESDQYKAYGETSIWFEQINLLAQYRTKHRQEWTKLLTTFGLQHLSQQPIADLTAEAQ